MTLNINQPAPQSKHKDIIAIESLDPPAKTVKLHFKMHFSQKVMMNITVSYHSGKIK